MDSSMPSDMRSVQRREKTVTRFECLVMLANCESLSTLPAVRALQLSSTEIIEKKNDSSNARANTHYLLCEKWDSIRSSFDWHYVTRGMAVANECVELFSDFVGCWMRNIRHVRDTWMTFIAIALAVIHIDPNLVYLSRNVYFENSSIHVNSARFDLRAEKCNRNEWEMCAN